MQDADFDGDGDQTYTRRIGDGAGFVPTGKKRDARFRTRDGGEGVKEKVVNKYRACLVCKVIASESQFFSEGCPNCPFLDMRGSRASVWDCTSTNFSGMIALIRPDDGWSVFKERCIPGCYAAEVYGELPERVKDLVA